MRSPPWPRRRPCRRPRGGDGDQREGPFAEVGGGQGPVEDVDAAGAAAVAGVGRGREREAGQGERGELDDKTV